LRGHIRGLRKDRQCISHHRQESLPTAIAAVDPQGHAFCVQLWLLTCRIRERMRRLTDLLQRIGDLPNALRVDRIVFHAAVRPYFYDIRRFQNGKVS
jgi:hypothetical protein